MISIPSTVKNRTRKAQRYKTHIHGLAKMAFPSLLGDYAEQTVRQLLSPEVPTWDEGMAPVPRAEKKTQAPSPQGLQPTGANHPGLLPTTGDQGEGARRRIMEGWGSKETGTQKGRRWKWVWPEQWFSNHSYISNPLECALKQSAGPQPQSF